MSDPSRFYGASNQPNTASPHLLSQIRSASRGTGVSTSSGRKDSPKQSGFATRTIDTSATTTLTDRDGACSASSHTSVPPLELPRNIRSNMAKRSATGSTSSTLTSANQKESASASSSKTARKVAGAPRTKNDAPRSKQRASVPMSRTATDGSGSTASRSQRSTTARGKKRKYVELSEEEDDSQDLDAEVDATDSSSSGDSDDPDAIEVSASRESSIGPTLKSAKQPAQPTRKKQKTTRPPRQGVQRGRKRKISDTGSEHSQSPSPRKEKQQSSFPLKIKLAAKKTADPREGSSSRQPSPIPFVLRGLVKPKVEAEERTPSPAMLAAYTEDSQEDMDISEDSFPEAKVEQIFDDSYQNHSHSHEGETTHDTTILVDNTSLSVDPEARGAVSEVDHLSVQADDDNTPAVTPAELRQVELAIPIVVQEATPVKRKRGRPKKVINAPTASAQTSRAASPAPSASEASAPVATVMGGKLVSDSSPMVRRRSAIDAAVIQADRLQQTLDHERRLIEQDQHPLLVEALAPWNDMKDERMREFEILFQAKEQTRARVLQADEQQKWVQWEDAKRALWTSMLHFLEQKSQRLELENGDDEYSSIMCPIVKVQKAPDVLPIVRLQVAEGGASSTFLPLNDTIGAHRALDVSMSDINADLRVMGLGGETKIDMQSQQQKKKKFKGFPLGPGPVNSQTSRPKARFLGSRHPLRQLEPAVAGVEDSMPIDRRKPSLDEAVRAEGQRQIMGGRGGTKADAIIIGDDIPGSAPLTMESLAALEKEAARAEQVPLYSGRRYAEMPRCPGVPTIYDPAMAVRPDIYGYPGVPPPAPRQGFMPDYSRFDQRSELMYGDPRFPHGLPIGPPPDDPTTVASAPYPPPRVDRLGRQVGGRAASPPVPKSIRRADLAQQARIQLGLDPPGPSASAQRRESDPRSPPLPGYPYPEDPRAYPSLHPPHPGMRDGYMHPHQQGYPYEPTHHTGRPPQHAVAAGQANSSYPPPSDWPYHTNSGLHPQYGWPPDYPPPGMGYPPHDPRMNYPYAPGPASPPSHHPRHLYVQPGHYPPAGYPPYEEYPYPQQVPRRSSGGSGGGSHNPPQASRQHHHHRPEDAHPRPAHYERWG